MDTTVRRLTLTFVLLAILAIGVFGGVASALGLTVTGPATFSARTPADGSSVGVVRPPISVKAYDVKGLAGSPYYSMKVDGLAQTATFTRTDANNVTLSFTPRADMANGTHTVYVSVKNNAGVYSTTTWSFTVSRAPLPSAPSPIPGSTVNLTNPVVSVTVGGATAGLTSVVLLDGTAVPATFNAGTGVLSAPTSGLANDASHDVRVTVTNAAGSSATLDWSFSVQIYASMPTPASGCVSCHPGYPDAHPMDDCNACHGPNSPVGEGWNTPDYGPHAASYIAQDANSCVTCHTSGYATVPPLHSMTSGTTSHNSAGACAPCHVKSLTTEHYRYGKDCFTCHASSNPLVAGAIATGRTDCEACHPGAAAHTTVHETTVPAECSGSGCHSGTALTNIHTGTCASCHQSTDERVIAAIAGGIKTCDACHSTASHEAQHATTVVPSCAGAACHSGTSLTSIHINASTALSCSTCHDSGDPNVINAIATHNKSCTACHSASAPHPDETAAHTGALGSGDLDMKMDNSDHQGGVSSTQECTTCHYSDLRAQHGNQCQLCHSNAQAPLQITGDWNKTCQQGECHAEIHTASSTDHFNVYWGSSSSCSLCHDGNGGFPGDATRCTDCHSQGGMTVEMNPTLTYAAGAGGTISGVSPQTIAFLGTGSTVVAVPNSGYRFVNWSDGATRANRTDAHVSGSVNVTANFAPNVTFTLTYTAGSGGTISGTSPQTVSSGANGTAVTAVANTGYHFVNWSDGGATATRTETNVTANKSVTANFAINTYTLTYTAGSGGTVSGTNPQTVNHGASGTAVTAVANTGYHFVNWSDGGATATRTETNVTANKSVTANFAINTYTLTYTAGSGGTVSGTNPQTVNHGASGTAVTAVANTGYHFVNWSDGGATAARTETNVTANKSVTANFAANATYTLTYTAGANGSISGTSPQTVASGGSGTVVTAVANSGFHFVNWSDGIATASRTDTNVTADKSVTANFAVNVTYTLTYTAGSGGTISGTTPQTVASGGSGTLVTAVAASGFHFVSWSDGVASAARTDSNVTANQSVTANFAVDAGGTTTLNMTLTNSSLHAWMEFIVDENGTVIADSGELPDEHTGSYSVQVPSGHQYTMTAYWWIADYDGGGEGSDTRVVTAAEALPGATINWVVNY